MTRTLIALALSAGMAGACPAAFALDGAPPAVTRRPLAAGDRDAPGRPLGGLRAPRLLDVALDPGPDLRAADEATPSVAGALAVRLDPVASARIASLSYRRVGVAESEAGRGILACFGGFLFPGLGHAFAGAYLYRGLAFTAAFVASMVGAITFLAQADAHPDLSTPLGTGFVVLLATAEIVWVWSGIDALLLASHRPGERHRPAVRLGVD